MRFADPVVRDSPDESQTGINVRARLSCKTDARCSPLPAPRLTRTPGRSGHFPWHLGALLLTGWGAPRPLCYLPDGRGRLRPRAASPVVAAAVPLELPSCSRCTTRGLRPHRTANVPRDFAADSGATAAATSRMHDIERLTLSGLAHFSSSRGVKAQ